MFFTKGKILFCKNSVIKVINFSRAQPITKFTIFKENSSDDKPFYTISRKTPDIAACMVLAKIFNIKCPFKLAIPKFLPIHI